MSIYKDNVTGKWRVVYRYTDWTGETHQSSKRGFPTKREALMWERELLLKKEAKLDMTFESFYEIYVEDMQNRIRDNTWGTKTNIARTKILPYFGKRKIGEIEPRDIIAWQNELLAIQQPNGKPYSASYLQKIHSQLSAIFNHAVNFYHLPSNPAQKAGNMGKEEHREMLFWTKEEYLKFADAMMDKPVSYYAFEILYWCRLRMGELLALTPADFNFETHTLRINKSYQRLHREDVITPPKTLKSNRTIKMPQFLCDEIQDSDIEPIISETERAEVKNKEPEGSQPELKQPEMTRMASKYPRFFKIYNELEQRNDAIYKKEKQRSDKKKELSEIKGWFKGRKKKELQEENDDLTSQIRNMKDYLPKIVQKVGYRSVQEFLKDFKTAKSEYSQYQKAIAQW